MKTRTLNKGGKINSDPDTQVKSGVALALISLWFFVLYNIGSGLILVIKADAIPLSFHDSETTFFVLGIINLVMGTIYGFLALMIGIKKSINAAKWAFYLSGAELCLSIIGINPIAMVINALKFWLVKKGYDAMTLMKARRVGEEQQKRTKEYYEAFISILVYVMKADGNVNPDEVDRAKRYCNATGLTENEKDVFFRKAMDLTVFDVAEAVRRYLETAEAISVGWPQDRLMAAIAEVVVEDGDVGRPEEKIIYEIAQAMDYPSGNVPHKLKVARDKIKDENKKEALYVLGASEYSTREEIQALYRGLKEQYHPSRLSEVTPKMQAEMREELNDLEWAYTQLA